MRRALTHVSYPLLWLRDAPAYLGMDINRFNVEVRPDVTEVPRWIRKALLGHKNGDITEHYSPAELGELLAAVNKIDVSRGAPQVTLLGPLRQSCAEVVQKKRRAS